MTDEVKDDRTVAEKVEDDLKAEFEAGRGETREGNFGKFFSNDPKQNEILTRYPDRYHAESVKKLDALFAILKERFGYTYGVTAPVTVREKAIENGEVKMKDLVHEARPYGLWNTIRNSDALVWIPLEGLREERLLKSMGNAPEEPKDEGFLERLMKRRGSDASVSGAK